VSTPAPLGVRKAIYIPFSNAIPQVALLDVENCIMCGACAKVCPTKAVDYVQQPDELSIEASAVIVATGFQLKSLNPKPEYGGAWTFRESPASI